jgi:hypothetical protein
MPIASAISGMVMPGRSRTRSSACAERVPLPRGRPRRAPPDEERDEARRVRRAGAAAAVAVLANDVLLPMPDSAASAASSSRYSSTSGCSSLSRAWISLRFSSRKSAMLSVTPGQRVNV